jgi:hypothetical protein
MTTPLRISFDVACPAERAGEQWRDRTRIGWQTCCRTTRRR